MSSLVKKDIHNSERAVVTGLNAIKNSDMSDKQKKNILLFVEDLRIGKGGKKVKSNRISSYLQFLKKLHNHFKTDLDKITEKEARQFYINLQDNKIRRINGLEFSNNTKDMWVRTLKRYLGWMIGRDGKNYRLKVGWMKEDKYKVIKRAITLEQAQSIIKEEKNLRNKCLFLFLFDSGTRIEEALNIKLKDLEIHTRKNKKDEFFMINIRVSKTKPRRISIPIASKLLNQYIKEHPTKNPEDYLFILEYDNARKIVREMSKRVIDFPLTPHSLRHSSVTYYVKKFGLKDVAGFYYRFGWVFGSKEARTYIDEQLMGGEEQQEEIIKVVENERLEKMENTIEHQNKVIDNLIKALTHLTPFAISDKKRREEFIDKIDKLKTSE